MKLTKKLEAEILKAYHTLWDANLSGDIKTFASFLDNNITVYGTAAGEVFTTKNEAVKFYKTTADQMSGKADFRKRKIRIKTIGDTIVINEQCDLYVLAEKTWMFYGHARITAIFEQKGNSWKVVHMHGSFPDSRTEEGEQLNTDKIKAENIQLRDAVRRRTEELEEKNRELEIESALEKVRAQALGMRKAHELLNVCKVLFKELYSLGFTQLRNAIIHSFNDGKGVFTDYDYSDLTGGAITDISYDANLIIKRFIKQIRRSDSAFVQITIQGNELKDWKRFRQKGGQPNDPILNKASAIHYYLYSIHNASIGISTFDMIDEEKIKILKRFRNVFDFAYRRYVDIAQAEAQAREAEIELALERVRSRTMAMHKSDELSEIIEKIYNEFQQFGKGAVAADLMIITPDGTGYDIWVAGTVGTEGPYRTSGKLLSHPHHLDTIKAWKKGDSLRVTELTGNLYKSYFNLILNEPSGFISLSDNQTTISKDRKGSIRNLKSIVHTEVFGKYSCIRVASLQKRTLEQIDIQKRFANVFEQTYTRFLDLQKAEAQAREAQIEAALERVRSKTNAMHRSEDLHKVIREVYDQLRLLEFRFDGVDFMTDYSDKGFNIWLAAQQHTFSAPIYVPVFDHKLFQVLKKAKKEKKDFFTFKLDRQEKNKYIKHLIENTIVKNVSEEMKQHMLAAKGWATSCVALENIILSITNLELTPYTDAENAIIKRFAHVFQQSYTRFLDLEKAEAQAREAKIEASLERVRAKTMAMHKSSDLLDVVKVLGEQFELLDFKFQSVNFDTDFQDKDWNLWLYNVGSAMYPGKIHIPYIDHPCFNRPLEAFKKGGDLHSFVFTKEEKDGLFDHIYANSVAKYGSDERKRFTYASPGFAMSIAVTKNTRITIANYNAEPFSGEENAILRRFAIVFEQSYTRFLDLQKAEAQAREAQIEAALERVRSRTMAMQKTDELLDAAELVHKELGALGINSMNVSYAFVDEEEKYGSYYSINPVDGRILPIPFIFPHTETEVMRSILASWKKQESYNVIELKEKATLKHQTYIGEHIRQQLAKNNVPFSIEEFLQVSPKKAVISTFNFANGYLFNIGGERLSKIQEELMLRFTRVFEQTYTRFLDLKKAEAQAREAQIETALERVRSRTMGMQKSEELKEVIQVVYEQFVHLNIHIEHTGFIIDYKARNDMNIWLADKHEVPFQVTIPYFDSAHWNSFNEAKEKGLDFFANHLSFEDKNKFYQDLFKLIPGVTEEAKEYYFSCPGLAISTVLLENVGLYIENFSGIPYTDEENNTLMRFGKVFQQTYTRFLDLQKAEAQAREAKIEAALERVRSRTLAMQKSEELADTAVVLFKQMIGLGIEPNRLYIAIINDDSGDLEFWITDENGEKVSSRYMVNIHKNISIKKMYEGWAAKKKTITIDMQGKELEDWLNYWKEEFHVPFKPGGALKRRVQNIAYFSKGFVAIASPDDQPETTINLLERFAAVFNLTYTRFSDLKIAEAHALQAEEDLLKLHTEKRKTEEALAVLQATQKQLIQSEKMASLGELTAGIAHEIQNPLNFVNNFSEVSNELIEELKIKNEKLKIEDEEINELLNDIAQNLEKINHHGKRADGIVKGMLQHSRTSSGQKEPTDINVLAEEYLRLAYHGLRAKDKSFNAKFETEFDPTIHKIDLVQQDIGRVILNLINNAFYAVDEKKRQAQNGYEPVVTINTKKLDDTIEIAVKDNGNGIPKKVLDKIFQPFFTTKPTGQGTGLGLSLAYDIIKTHGGELKVDTEEGKGANFIISIPIMDKR